MRVRHLVLSSAPSPLVTGLSGARPAATAPPQVRARDLVVEITDPDATIADLVEALEPDRPIGPLLIDGRLVSPATPLDRAGIGDGATLVRPTDPRGSADQPPYAATASLAVTSGLGAGETFNLGPGSHRLVRSGRAVDAGDLAVADPTLTAAHACFTTDTHGAVAVQDLGSTNGTSANGLRIFGPTPVVHGDEIRCGAASLLVGPPVPSIQSSAATTSSSQLARPFHRPPRPVRPADPPPLVPPPPPDQPAAVTPIGILSVLVSVALGGVMVVVLGSWTYALFALLGPVVMVANALEARRRHRSQRRHGTRRRRLDLAAFEVELTARSRAELANRAQRAPGVHEALRVSQRADPTLWERRLAHTDAFEVRIGAGPIPWDPPIHGDPRAWAGDVTELVDRHRVIEGAAVGLRLTAGSPIAIVGPRQATSALARAIVIQATAAHGPADLRIAILVAPEHAPDWDWAAWLPHARDPEADSLLAGSPEGAEAVAASLAGPVGPVGPAPANASTHGTTSANHQDGLPDQGRPGPLRVVVLDDPAALSARRSPGRSILRASLNQTTRLVPIVLVEDNRAVPSACSVVLEVDADGTLRGPTSLLAGRAVVVGTTERLAAEAARALARWDDPEVDDPGRLLPQTVRLADLLGPSALTAAGLAARWRSAGPDPAPRASLGMAADGPFVVDLVTDGPHTLIAGTTGSGKSEMLRSLVASLACGASPEHLCFVLIDFKGGSAFDACARLPHTVGLVTDLDDHLAARALRCLEAELRYRERHLRQAGAEDLTDLRRRQPRGTTLPRLVVVIDEFATLAAELPDFIDALVGVAQRGRSLGVHLVLATQRPSGSVSDHIQANTSLRAALRVHSPADSTDVIGVPDAAALPRQRPGRALVRLGPGEIVAIQTALATTRSETTSRPAVRIRPLGIEREPRATIGPAGMPTQQDFGASNSVLATESDLDRLVDAATEAWDLTDGEPPRRPWPEPLAREIAWPVSLAATDSGTFSDQSHPSPFKGAELVVGIADDPDRQRQVPFAWRPADGPLLAVGLPGAGTTTLAATTVLAAAARWSASSCHIHVVDLGAGHLLPLAGLAHVGAVIGGGESERQRRLFAELEADLAARRANLAMPGPERPHRIVVIDGLGAFRARWDEVEPSGTWSRLLALVAGGAAVGIHLVLTADSVGAAPNQIVASCQQRLVFRLGERRDHGAFGISAANVPVLGPGRAVAAEGETLVQIARSPDGLANAVGRLTGTDHGSAGLAGGPAAVSVLPAELAIDHLAEVAQPAVRTAPDGTLSIAVGLSDVGLAPARLVLDPAGHAIVAGPPRSGRTTTLATIATLAAKAGLRVVVVSRQAEPWADLDLERFEPDDSALASAIEQPGPMLVVVDDADLTADDHPVLHQLAAERRTGRHLVAGGRSDRLRTLYAHWTRELRADRCGLLLLPDADLDGEITGARLPRHPGVEPCPGRGWLSGGLPEGMVQVARRPAHEP